MVRLASLAGILLAAATPVDAGMPVIPPSERILSLDEVKNFWIHSLRGRPIPPKPSGLYPERIAAWRSALRSRRDRIEAIRGGIHDTEARLAQLAHNAEAHRRRGDEAGRHRSERELFELREHLATLAKLQAERRAAQDLSRAARQVDALASEVSSLRAEIASCPDPSSWSDSPSAPPSCPPPSSSCPPPPPSPFSR